MKKSSIYIDSYDKEDNVIMVHALKQDIQVDFTTSISLFEKFVDRHDKR